MSRVLTLALAVAVVSPGHAEKRITVKITHSPALAEAAGKRITVGRVTGDCAREFGELIRNDLRVHGVGIVTSDPAASLIPAAIISVDVSRCEAHTQQPILGSGLPAVHISRTEGTFVALVRAVDPADGRELAAVSVRGHAQKENQSQTLAPEYPAPADVKVLAMRQGLAEAARLYSPWIENREIPFSDNKECRLKQAFDLAKAGDYQALLPASRANAESCGQSKAAMEAWYNLGVANMVLLKYGDAISAFEKAEQLNGGKLVDGLLDECRKEAAALQARQPKPQPAAAPGAPVQTGILMTNSFVIRLVDANIDEQEILQMIANQPGRFSFAQADLERLKAAQVPDAIVAAMRSKH